CVQLPGLRRCQHLCLTAGGGDLLSRLSAEFVRADGERLRDLAPREHLHAALAADEPVLAEQVRRDLRPGLEPLGDRVEVDDLVGLAERVVESALRHAAVQRHLAAFEPALVLEARTRLRALVAAPRRLAVAGALPAADPLLRVLGALGRTQIAQIHDRQFTNSPNYSTLTRCLTLWIMPRTAGVSGSSTVWRKRRRPIPSTTFAWLRLKPIVLFTSVIRIVRCSPLCFVVFAICSFRLKAEATRSLK